MTTDAPAQVIAPPRRKEPTRMEQLFNVVVFLVFFLLWAAFAYGLVLDQGGLNQVWKSIQGQHIIVQGAIWLLFLPVTIGLWIWESAWPLLVRLPLVIAIAAWNIWMFFPKSVIGR